MKRIMVSIFVLICVYAQCQTTNKSYSPFKLKSGQILKVGDTIHLVKGSMPDGTFRCGILLQNKWVEDYGNAPLVYLGKTYAKKFYIINYFITHKIGSGLTYAAFTINNRYRAELLIECAIASGEINLHK